MNLGKLFSHNKNLLSLILGIALVGYLYLGAPNPISHISNDISLFIIIAIFLVTFVCLFKKVHIIVIILAVVALYEVIKNHSNIDVSNVNRQKLFYSKKEPNQVISPILKNDVTLEETIVDKMVPIVRHVHTHPTPRYQGITGDLSQTSPI